MALLVLNNYLLLAPQAAPASAFALEDTATNRYTIFALGADAIGGSLYKPGTTVLLANREYDTLEHDGTTYTIATPSDIVAVEVNHAA